MKPWKQRLCALSLSALLACGPATPAAWAKETSTQKDQDQTVYVYTSPTGAVRETTVRTSTWDVDGKEQQTKAPGSTELPLSVHVTYTLDGAPIQPDKLAGKSGRVTIRLDYANASKRVVSIGGKATTIYTPFVAMSTVNLDRDVFSHVSATNGRVLDGSDKISVVGVALPGLQESLDLDADDLEIPSYVQIEADAKDFSLDSIVTIVTPELLSDLDTSSLDTADLTDARDGLREAMDGLTQGTRELADGMQQLVAGQEALGNGLAQFADKAGALPAATSTLAQGATAVRDGVGAAHAGATRLADGSAEVASALGQITDGLGAGAAGVAGISSALDGVSAGLATLTQGAETPTLPSMDVGALDEALVALRALEQTDETTAAIAALEQAKATVAALGASADKIGEQSATVAQGLAAAREGVAVAQGIATQVGDGIGTAKSALESTAAGAWGIQSGAASLADGLGELESGAGQLANGLAEFSGTMPQLVTGLDALKQGANQLAQGTQAAATGSSALATGVSTFDRDGIQKLIGELDDSGIATLGERLDALSQAAKDYQSFSATLADGKTGSVKFVIKTESVA